jgi:ribose transport system permease protein
MSITRDTRTEAASVPPSPDGRGGGLLDAEQSGALERVVAKLPSFGTLAGLLLLFAVFSALKSSTFPTGSNLLTILDQASLLGIVAGGLTACLILGEFDLSIGYTATLGGVVATRWLGSSFSVEWIVLALGAGVLVGLVNGFIVAYGRINAFIATLGTGAVVYGIVLAITGGTAEQVNSTAFEKLGQGKVVGIPAPVIISGVLLIVLWVVFNKTEPGRRIDAVGANSEAARLSGIRVSRYRLLGFVTSGFCAAAAGIVLASELGAGYSDAGDNYLLQAFTACFLGAVTLRDGEFHIIGTAVGVLIMGVAFNGLAQLGVAAYWQNIAQGAILVGAVSIATLTGRLQTRLSRRRRVHRSRLPG